MALAVHVPEGTMSDLPFDPSKAVTFDLAHGLVHLDGAPRRLLVPADALMVLAQAAGDSAAAGFGRTLGEAMGQRVANRLASAGGTGAVVVEVVVEHLAGELALSGLGSLGLERWGRGLVMVLDQSPLAAAGDLLVGAVLEGAIAAASGRKVHAVLLNREAVRARFLIGGAAGATKARGWISEGIAWGEVLVRLHQTHDTPRGDA